MAGVILLPAPYTAKQQTITGDDYGLRSASALRDLIRRRIGGTKAIGNEEFPLSVHCHGRLQSFWLDYIAT